MNIHITGIEGAGTSALAELYAAAGHRVSGSDDGDGFYRAQLAALGITLHTSFDATNVPADTELLVHSTAFGDTNLEIAAARSRGVTVLPYPEAVAAMFNATDGIAVAGTHGKTTTTAMLTEVLAACGENPSAIVGSQVAGWRGNARVGGSRVMVLEADEYQDKIRFYDPRTVVLTSVDYDHPDFFATPEDYVAAFRAFVARIPADGLLVANGDHPRVRLVAGAARCRVVTYGFGIDNDMVITDFASTVGDNGPQTTFTLAGEMFRLRLPGRHNVLNAAAAITVAREREGRVPAIAEALARFRGAKRRFEYRTPLPGIAMIDDYGHHPTEVAATLAGARAIYGDRRIVAAFHPHTFTRTRALLGEFATCFADADAVVVIDIYGSARETHGGVSSRDLVDAINAATPGRATHVPTIADLAVWARTHLVSGDVFITLGAGDIWKVHDLITGSNT